MDLTEFPAEVVKKFNVHNIEPHSRHFRSLDPAYLASFREALDKAGVKAVNIAVDGPDSFYDTDAAASQKGHRLTLEKSGWMSRSRLDLPAFGLTFRGPNSEPNVHARRNPYERWWITARKKFVVNLENDDLVSEDAFFMVKVIEAVDHPYLRALPDFANSMLNGDADFNYRALQAMFQHAYCICHVKDGEDRRRR